VKGAVRIRPVWARPARYTCAVEAIAGVVTTGIYCRPGCGASPHPHNVRVFPLPAAAEAAGYRSCLRCRPYRWPQSVGWEPPELVCRAVRLILDGALDHGTEAELGARLGISARHLRRLFRTHLGVTPDGLARSARVHFARRLLDDTDLTVTEIAFAAGFGSLRQLNRACQEVFRESPKMLRARRRKSDRLVADGGLLLRLTYRGALDWERLLAFLASRAIPGVEHVSGDTYRRTIVSDGDPGVIELWPGGDDHLLLLAHLPHWQELVHLVQRVRRIAGLDFDFVGATEHLGGDPAIGPLIAARPGLRPPGAWDGFETGVRAIAGQQVTVAGANTLTGRLVERFGTRVPGLEPLGLTHLFPSPETLAEADLNGVGLTRTRAEAIRGLARAVVDDRVRLDGSVSLDALVSSLTTVKGLGSWTAHYLALRLGEPDAFPTTGLVPEAERWRPWRALAATHLWLVADAQEAPVRIRRAS
jgi:AraC family transcriptional regulator, regulatory protein of adaptative response / DNA-3-methyladenine glycosylase II